MNKDGYRKGDAWVATHKRMNTPQGEVGLPHQCDDWCIGDADNVQLMIEDLTTLLTELRQREAG